MNLANLAEGLAATFALVAAEAKRAQRAVLVLGHTLDRMNVPASRCRAMKKNGRACRLRRPCGIHGRRRR